MGTRTRVSLVVLVAALVAVLAVQLVMRVERVESAPMEAAESRAADAPPADSPGFTLPSAEAAPPRVVVHEPPVDASAHADRQVLRVILEGIQEEDARLAKVTVTGGDERDAWPCTGATSEFELGTLLERAAERDGASRVDELHVEVDHPTHLLASAQVALSRGVASEPGLTVHVLRVRLIPAAVMHGFLVREDGSAAANGLVGALPLAEPTWPRPTTDGSTLSDVPVEGEGRAVACSADGGFELRVPASGRHLLACHEEGRRPTTLRVQARVGTRLDVGTIVLEPGHAITGHVRRHGLPLAGATLSLTQPRVYWAAEPADVAQGLRAWIDGRRTFNAGTRAVTLDWLDGRFELPGQRSSVDESGAFAFGGLAPRDYRLRVVELAGSRFLPSGWDNPALGEEGPDERVVRAPAHGVVLDFAWTSVRFELQGDLEAADEGRLVLRTRSLHPGNEHVFIPEFWSTEIPLAGSEPTFVLQAPPDTRILGEATFPGRRPVELDFRTPPPGGQIVVSVVLLRAEDAATLVIDLENPPSDLPDVFTVLLWRVGQDAAPPDARRVDVVEGRLRVESVPAGTYRVRLCAGEDPNHPGLFFCAEFEVELLADVSTTRSITLRQGAGVRVDLRDERGEPLAGQYEFYDDAGHRVTLVLVVTERWQPGSDRWASTSSLLPLGSHRSTMPIEPGRYRLVLRAPGHAERSVSVELRAGVYADVDVTLSR